MTKKTLTPRTTKTETAEKSTITESNAVSEGRSKRRKVYEAVKVSKIPAEVTESFAKDNYELRLVRWLKDGQEDSQYLYRREKEGYEFVKPSELDQDYLRTLRVKETSVTKGMVTMGDLCIMKIDSDLRASRRDHFAGRAQSQLDSVDINVLEKKGFRNVGSKSQVLNREPNFQA